MVNGLFVGMGGSIGVWLITRHFLRHIENLEKKLRNVNGDGKNSKDSGENN